MFIPMEAKRERTERPGGWEPVAYLENVDGFMPISRASSDLLPE